MKRKHQGIIAIVLFFVVVTGMAVYAVMVTEGQTARVPVPRLKMLPNLGAPDASVIQEMDRMQRVMVGLSHPPGRDPAPVDLALFGLVPLRVSDRASIRRPRRVPMDYTVTMAFASGRKRFCVIDGELYHQGAELPDGGRILGISSRRVLVSKMGARAWIPVVPWHLGPVKRAPDERAVPGKGQKAAEKPLKK